MKNLLVLLMLVSLTSFGQLHTTARYLKITDSDIYTSLRSAAVDKWTDKPDRITEYINVQVDAYVEVQFIMKEADYNKESLEDALSMYSTTKGEHTFIDYAAVLEEYKRLIRRIYY